MPFRIAILGGGPAGSALALGLVDRGVDPGDLVILDKARFPRPKLCGGALTWRGTESLSSLVGRPPGGGATSSLEFRSSVGRLDVFEKGPQWLYDRAWLDDALLSAVKARGVEVREGAAVTALEPAHDGWRVRTGRSTETFPWVVGADGACGISRRAAALRGGRMGRLVEAVYEPVDADPDPSRLLFDFDPVLEGIPGYTWIFPYPSPDGAKNLYKIGIMDGRGRVSGSELRAYTERFAVRSGFRRVDEKIGGWPERYFTWTARGHRPGLVLVGEAYGIDPLLGEGIAPALAHASYAADRLRAALDAGSRTIRGYERGFLATVEGQNLLFQTALADLIYGRAGRRWLKVLFDLPRLRALALTRQEAYGRLAHHGPRLFASYLFYLCTRGFPAAAPPPCSTAP